ncbi:MAG TPA: DUF6249 domain-containing protein [Blastocatellia bacterium]|nr:DUF6249 domain-containing protein [Blastocatellia bacterium]
MYCPRCGRPAADRQRYCTGCGTNLLIVSQALEQSPSEREDDKAILARVNQFRHGVHQMFTGIGLALFFLFFFGSMRMAAIGLLIFLIGLGRSISAVLVASPRLMIGVDVPIRRGPTEQLTADASSAGWTPHRSSRRETTPSSEWRTPIASAPPVEPPRVTEHTTLPLQSPEMASSRRGEKE